MSTSNASRAVLNVEICVAAAVTRPRWDTPENFGRTMAAKVPRMTSTSSNSTKVNARCSRRTRVNVREMFFIMVWGLFDVLLQGEDWQQHPDEDGADESRDEKQHQRFREGNRGFQLPVEIALGHVGDPDQFRVQPSAFLGDGNHFQHGTGKQPAALRQALP